MTIFGQKWPGAIKYRDIFDALSGSLFKLTMQPATMVSQANASCSQQLGMDTEPILTTLSSDERTSSRTMDTRKPTMSHLVTDAVKEAFMEVDEEAPGGWQGWRMWNDMVRDEVAPTPGPAVRHDGTNDEQHFTTWGACESSGTYGIDPIQDAAIHMANQAAMDMSHWNFGTLR
jgi:hypothetical protein